MTKAKKTTVRKSALDRIATQLRQVLRRQTTDVILAGELLIEARKHLAHAHGEWQPWLTEHFTMSLRTAQNYVAAAEYVARQKQIGNVADFSNLSPGLLYALAEGRYGYDEDEEAAILAATRTGRVGRTRADEICDALKPPPPDDDADDDAADDGGDDAAAGEDPEITAIFDNPPVVQPPAPIAPTNFALVDFDDALRCILRHVTKSAAQFAGTRHSADDLEKIESFIRAVADRARKARENTERAP